MVSLQFIKLNTMEKLKKIASKIVTANPRALISGSLAINLQDYKTRREPVDIDVWIPEGVKFVPIDGMIIDSDSDHYEETTHHRTSYLTPSDDAQSDICVDVFTPIYGNAVGIARTHMAGLPLVQVFEILKFKVEHAFDEYYYDEGNKHLDDLLFILTEYKEKVKIKDSLPF